MNLITINHNLFHLINDLGISLPFLNPFMIFIAEYTVVLLAVIMVLFFFSKRKKDRIMSICAGFSFIVAEFLGKIAGKFYVNYQPFVVLPDVNQLIEKAVNNSFPSDHTILFFSICTTFYFFQKGRGVLWLLLALLVGISRIWVGVHYPLDVLVGACIGFISSLLIYQLYGKIFTLNKKHA